MDITHNKVPIAIVATVLLASVGYTANYENRLTKLEMQTTGLVQDKIALTTEIKNLHKMGSDFKDSFYQLSKENQVILNELNKTLGNLNTRLTIIEETSNK